MSKPVSGPWEIGLQIPGGQGIVYAYRNFESSQHKIFRICTLSEKGFEDEGERKATAVLIAAAPDMLAALKEVVEFFGQPSAGTSPKLKALIEKMAEAIAKAEGEE